MLEAKKIDESKALRDHLPQLYDYLRRLCLEHRYPHLCGVLTNYKSWIFVKFDLMKEVVAVHDELIHGDQVAAHFEVCQEITILDDLHKLKPHKLAKVIDIIGQIHLETFYGITFNGCLFWRLIHAVILILKQTLIIQTMPSILHTISN